MSVPFVSHTVGKYLLDKTCYGCPFVTYIKCQVICYSWVNGSFVISLLSRPKPDESDYDIQKLHDNCPLSPHGCHLFQILSPVEDGDLIF